MLYVRPALPVRRAGDTHLGMPGHGPLGNIENMEEREWVGAKAETPESQSYVGLSRADALEAAETAGVKAVRVIEGSQHLTADFRPDRLNIVIADGYVTKAAFF
jgi:hypothetical protein